MKEVAGSALVCRELTACCTKCVIKPLQTHFMECSSSYVYTMREASAAIIEEVSAREKESILKHFLNKDKQPIVKVNAGEVISGKRLLLYSDVALSKAKVGTSNAVSGRHKRQDYRLKSEMKCMAFVVSTWSGDNIDPPDPYKYLEYLYLL